MIFLTQWSIIRILFYNNKYEHCTHLDNANKRKTDIYHNQFENKDDYSIAVFIYYIDLSFISIKTECPSNILTVYVFKVN